MPEPKIFGLDLGPYGIVPRARRQGAEPGVRLLRASRSRSRSGLLVANLRRSDLGQRMLAVRSNERAAAAAGINVRNVKLAAFGIASFIAGIAGALYGYNFSSVTVSRFSALTALSLIALAYVGGITMVSGAVFAGLISVEALFPYALEKWFGVSGNWALLFGGRRPDRDARPEPGRRRRRRLPAAAVEAEAAGSRAAAAPGTPRGEEP